MKRVTIGIIIGLMLGLSTQVFAVEVTTEVRAVFAKVNLFVNGEEKVLEADPLIYQGSTYLPVRVVSNMLGYDVTYKADTRTIELSTPVEGAVVEVNKGDGIVTTDMSIEIQLEFKKRSLKSAEKLFIEHTNIMESSRSFYEENLPKVTYESTDPNSLYQRYLALINADKAEIDRLTAEIAVLEAQLQPQ